VKLTDFGLSKLRLETLGSGTSLNYFVGTKSWAAPEMCNDVLRNVMSRVCHNPKGLDVWSLGIVLYNILTITTRDVWSEELQRNRSASRLEFPGTVSEEDHHGKDVSVPGLSTQSTLDADVRKHISFADGLPTLQPLILRHLRTDSRERIGIDASKRMLLEQFPGLNTVADSLGGTASAVPLVESASGSSRRLDQEYARKARRHREKKHFDWGKSNKERHQ